MNDKFENIENQKNQNLFSRRNKINENNKYINTTESGNKFKKETLIQSIKSSGINSLSQKNTNLFNSHKFLIKNYLIKNFEEIKKLEIIKIIKNQTLKIMKLTIIK